MLLIKLAPGGGKSSHIYWGRDWLESQTCNQSAVSKVWVVFLSPSTQLLEWCLLVGHDHLLPKPIPFKSIMLEALGITRLYTETEVVFLNKIKLKFENEAIYFHSLFSRDEY
jgi:hypothetical protein